MTAQISLAGAALVAQLVIDGAAARDVLAQAGGHGAVARDLLLAQGWGAIAAVRYLVVGRGAA